jgi:RimJ/RimL family protein N-acetyltransferase
MFHFRTLDRCDLPLMHRWLHTPHVVEWWPDEALTLDQIIAKYAPRIDGKEDVRCFVIVHGDAPIGYIQEYPIVESEYASCIADAERAAGIDLFIGEVEFHHRGLGAPIIRQFLSDVVFADPAIETCIIDPAVTNRGAIRAYEKAGFHFLATVTNPDTAEAQWLMKIGRAEFAR